MVQKLLSVVQALGVLIALATLLGYMGKWWWVFDLFSHFRMQYALTFIVLAIIFLAGKRKRIALLFGAFMLVNVLAIAPLYLPASY